VGELWIHVQWDGKKPLEKNGPVVLAAFDASPESWGAVKDHWGEKSCEEKLQAATWVRKLGQFQYWFRVDVHQETYARDWHFALLTCGPATEVEQANMVLSVEAVDGALAVFEPDMAFDDSSCPAVAVPDWWETALRDTRFWIALVGVVLFGCCAAVLCFELRHVRAERARRRDAAAKSKDAAFARAAGAGLHNPSSQDAPKSEARSLSIAADPSRTLCSEEETGAADQGDIEAGPLPPETSQMRKATLEQRFLDRNSALSDLLQLKASFLRFYTLPHEGGLHIDEVQEEAWEWRSTASGFQSKQVLEFVATFDGHGGYGKVVVAQRRTVGLPEPLLAGTAAMGKCCNDLGSSPTLQLFIIISLVVYVFLTLVNIVIDFLQEEYEIPHDILDPSLAALTLAIFVVFWITCCSRCCAPCFCGPEMPDVPAGCMCQQCGGNPAMMDCPFYIVFLLYSVAGSPDAAIDSILNDPEVSGDRAMEMVEFIDNFTWLRYLRFLLLGLALFGILQAIKKCRMMLNGECKSASAYGAPPSYGGAPPVAVGAPVTVPAVVQATVVQESNQDRDRRRQCQVAEFNWWVFRIATSDLKLTALSGMVRTELSELVIPSAKVARGRPSASERAAADLADQVHVLLLAAGGHAKRKAVARSVSCFCVFKGASASGLSPPSTESSKWHRLFLENLKSSQRTLGMKCLLEYAGLGTFPGLGVDLILVWPLLFLAWVVMMRNFLCLGRWCLRDRQAERASQQLFFATRASCSRPKKAGSHQSRFNGVYWYRWRQRFRVSVWFQGRSHFAGYFSNDTEAACASDAKLRAICTDPVRLKKSLNFPTNEEASYEEPLSQMRSRGLKKNSKNCAKGVESFQRLQNLFSKCPQASEFEIVNVPSQSRVDALFQPRGSKSGGLPLQLKSSSCRNTNRGEYYAFQHTSGYDGMLLVLIALDHDMIWMVPGRDVSQKSLTVRLGSERDTAWRASYPELALVEYFKKGRLPHMSLEHALLQCSGNHIVEEHAHAQLASVLGSVGLRLHRPASVSDTVDSVLSWQENEWHVQEKAAHVQASGKYKANLRKHGGCLGTLAYESADFDILTISLLDVSDRLVGLYLFPSCVLAKRKLVGGKAVQLHLYPPWSQPKRPAVAARHSWQLDHFVDLRSWKGKDFHLDPSSMESLTELLDKLLGKLQPRSLLDQRRALLFK
ncbi:unnamed protein product, partial [Symbiodinium sp. KB8]